jgi:hypothetical protein
VTLDTHLPRYDFHEVHSTLVRATPEATIAAAKAMVPRDVPLTVSLMAVRGLPTLLSRRGPGLSVTMPVLEQFERAGFAVLAESQTELVMGGVGRFWRPSGNLRPVDAAGFAAFDEPGFAKGAFNLSAEPEGAGRCRLTTETRVLATDAAARRDFGRYWRVIQAGSGLIRREWLWAIRRRAESA